MLARDKNKITFRDVAGVVSDQGTAAAAAVPGFTSTKKFQRKSETYVFARSHAFHETQSSAVEQQYAR